MNIALDDGVQFGLGFFETICLRDGQPEFLDWHLERINHSLAFFNISQIVKKEEVVDWLKDTLCQKPFPTEVEKKQPDTAEGSLQALKIMVSEQNKHFLLRHNPYTKEVIEKGFQLDYSPILRNETSPLVSHKSMNYGDNILEKRRAIKHGIDDLVFLNSKGQLAEGSTTNIFFVKNGIIYTPNTTCGLLPGVMRRFVMEHFPVVERIVYPEDVQEMDECFVTNSLMGIVPVIKLDEKAFVKGPKTLEIRKSYEGFCEI